MEGCVLVICKYSAILYKGLSICGFQYRYHMTVCHDFVDLEKVRRHDPNYPLVVLGVQCLLKCFEFSAFFSNQAWRIGSSRSKGPAQVTEFLLQEPYVSGVLYFYRSWLHFLLQNSFLLLHGEDGKKYTATVFVEVTFIG